MISVWDKHAGPILIVFAQFFAASMNLCTRYLELEDGMHPMQILCARMTVTIICCFGYMWWKGIPGGPWGPSEVRWLLVVRALVGFLGLYGMWCSIIYLPLAEATVISFLAPNVAGYLCRIFLKEPFTRREQLASYLALAGVVLITRPMSLLSGSTSATPESGMLGDPNVVLTNSTAPTGTEYSPTTAERLTSIGAGLAGVIGAAATIVVLRAIGHRAHALISVNYFSTFCSAVTLAVLSAAPLLDYDQPALRFAAPTSWRQVLLLVAIAGFGFATQITATMGLAREKSNRGTAMIYTHVLFAAAFDRWFFGAEMGWLSVAGCGLIVGSALWVALGKSEEGSGKIEDIEGRALVAVAAGAGGEDQVLLDDLSELGSDDEDGLYQERRVDNALGVEMEALGGLERS